MLTTAKSIQLLDASGMNISPITDITSLYYEVASPNNDNIITRKYVYQGFPIGVNISTNVEASIGTAVVSRPTNIKLYENGEFYKFQDGSTNSDILVSNVSTSIIKGTTYRQINVKNYNLSEILTYYTPLDLMDTSIGQLNTSVNNLNWIVQDISTKVNNITNSLDTSVDSLYNITQYPLIPNKFYLINNYYYDPTNNQFGCMDIPTDTDKFSGLTGSYKKSLLVKANTSTSLDGKLYNMYDGINTDNPLNVYGTYELTDSGKIRITYLKDQYGNEAPYDFYNLKMKGREKPGDLYYYNTTFYKINTTIRNNIIKTNPFICGYMPVITLYPPYDETGSYKVSNNYIGYNCSIYIDSFNDSLTFENNIIDSSNIIDIKQDDDYSTTITNMIMHNNNQLIVEGNNNIKYNNININNNNIINIDNANILNNLIINSSNNITLSQDASNVTILDNCKSYIRLANNIIVDNYINTTALTTTPNTVYMFGQNVYAKSFNTLRE